MNAFQNHNPVRTAPQIRTASWRTMRITITIVSTLTLLSALACKSAENPPAPSSTPAVAESGTPLATTSPAAASSPANMPKTFPGKVDACTLLNSDEIQAVQGEALKTTKPSQQAGHEFVIDICYYELPTPSNSVSLSLAQPNPDKRDAVKEFWENTFAESEHGERREKEREGEGEIEGGAPARKIKGLGQEAFWFSSPIGGVLYVLKGEHYIRISVGGKGTSEQKLNKSQALAKKALARL